MQNEHQLLEEALCLLDCGLICRAAVCWLNNLKVPTAKVVPEELIGNHKCLRDAVATEVILNLGKGSVHLSTEPSHCSSVIAALGKGLVYVPAVDKAVCVPNLITEVTTLLAE